MVWADGDRASVANMNNQHVSALTADRVAFGNSTFTEPSALTDGTVLDPAIQFTSENSLGFYRSGASELAVSYGTFVVSDLSAMGKIHASYTSSDVSASALTVNAVFTPAQTAPVKLTTGHHVLARTMEVKANSSANSNFDVIVTLSSASLSALGTDMLVMGVPGNDVLYRVHTISRLSANAISQAALHETVQIGNASSNYSAILPEATGSGNEVRLRINVGAGSNVTLLTELTAYAASSPVQSDGKSALDTTISSISHINNTSL